MNYKVVQCTSIMSFHSQEKLTMKNKEMEYQSPYELKENYGISKKGTEAGLFFIKES